MNRNKVSKVKGGFTLIELVIVVVIIGILAGIAALNMYYASMKTRDGVAVANLRAMKSAVNLYQSAYNGAYPPPLGNHVAQNGKAAIIGIDNFKHYLEERTFQEPGEAYTYQYEIDASGTPVLTVTGGKLEDPPLEGENRYTFR